MCCLGEGEGGRKDRISSKEDPFLQLFESKMLIRQFLAMLEKDERSGMKSIMEALHSRVKTGQVEQEFLPFHALLSAKSTALAQAASGSPAPLLLKAGASAPDPPRQAPV